MGNPYQVVKDFEQALCEYTGAPYAVTTTSCTMALLLACAWWYRQGGFCMTATEVLARRNGISIPKHTYVSVPMSIIHVGYKVCFRQDNWSGAYPLTPLPVYDSARRFTGGMYKRGQFQCVSFHWSKILAIGQGGAILHTDPEADAWFRKARFDGRTEGVHPKDDDIILGWQCYMSPKNAAEGLSRLSVLPEHNEDLPNSDYPDLSQMECFK